MLVVYLFSEISIKLDFNESILIARVKSFQNLFKTILNTLNISFITVYYKVILNDFFFVFQGLECKINSVSCNASMI